MTLGKAFSPACLAVCVVALAAAGCGGTVSAPTSYDTYNAKDGSFRCKCPAGWEVKGGGRSDFHSASFAEGPAKIKVRADFAGSIIGDIAGGGMAGLNAPGLEMAADEADDFSAVAQVHQMGKEEMAEAFGNYEETPAEKIDTKLGEGRKAEFTGSNTFGGKMHGVRLTILSHDRRITVVCQCPEKNWETLKPAFDEVIDSLRPGEAEV